MLSYLRNFFMPRKNTFTIKTGNETDIQFIKFSPDNKYIIAGDDKGSYYITTDERGEYYIAEFKPGIIDCINDQAGTICITTEGNILYNDKDLRFDIDTDSVSINAWDISGNGKWLLMGYNDNKVRVVELASKKLY